MRREPSSITSPIFPRLLPAAFFLVIMASRIPLLGGGFGSDDDAWRNAVSALRMREAGHYVASRLPGFPVFEGLLVPLVPLGPVATNLAAALAGAFAALIFLAIARRLRVRSPAWLTFAFAFGGVMWVHTTQTMDYAVGIAFLLGAYWALLDRRYLAGGLLMALAAGCRPTMGAFALPALIMLLVRKDGLRSIAVFIASLAACAVILFIPVLVTIDPQQFAGEALWHTSKAHATPAALPGLVRSSAVFLFGKIGAAAMLLSLIWGILVIVRRRKSGAPGARSAVERSPHGPQLRPDAADRRAAPWFEAGVVIITGALFLLIPYEPAYLIPLFPFLLLLVGRLLGSRLLAVIALLMASEVLVMPLFGQRRLVPGRLFNEMERRRADLESTRELAARRFPEPTIVVIGRFGVHRLLVLEPELERTEAGWAPFRMPGVGLWSADRRLGFAAYLETPEREALETQGYRIVDLAQ